MKGYHNIYLQWMDIEAYAYNGWLP